MTRYDYVEERTHVKEAYKDGAEFSYNKAKKVVEEVSKKVIETQNLFITQLQEEIETLKKNNVEITDQWGKEQRVYDLELEISKLRASKG